MNTYASPIVRVTWTLDAVTDGGTRTDLVDLTRGRERGRADDDTIRAVVACGWMGDRLYARHVRILSVAPAAYPVDMVGSFHEGLYTPGVTA